jgi:hypothetical protein
MRQSSALDWRQESGNGAVIGWECPDCHSTDLVRLSLIYATGVAAITGVTRGRALGIGENGISVNYGKLKTSGTLQTELSRIANPPRRKKYRYLIATWIFGLYLAAIIAGAMQSGAPSHVARIHQQFDAFVWVYSTAIFVVLTFLWHHNHGLYAQRYRPWTRSSMCRRCGTIVRVDSHD